MTAPRNKVVMCLGDTEMSQKEGGVKRRKPNKDLVKETSWEIRGKRETNQTGDTASGKTSATEDSRAVERVGRVPRVVRVGRRGGGACCPSCCSCCSASCHSCKGLQEGHSTWLKALGARRWALRVISTASEDRGLKLRAAVIGVHWGVGVLKNLCSNTARDHITPEHHIKK